MMEVRFEHLNKKCETCGKEPTVETEMEKEDYYTKNPIEDFPFGR